MTVQQQIAAVIAREGDYVDHPADNGGPTRWGITKAIARAEGYSGDMRALPQTIAAGIYFKRFWVEPHLNFVAELSPAIAAELFDTGINCGPDVAGRLLQRALNAVAGAGLVVDGAIAPGGATIGALATFLARRRGDDGEAVLLCLLNCLQGERYVDLVEKRGSLRAFIFGWLRNRVLAPA